MPDSSKKFHEFALKSILFKGRSDWYFCYLKAERISHVLLALSESAPLGELDTLLISTGELPGAIAHLAAGEVDAAAALADVFGILSLLRLAVARHALSKDTGAVLCREYEGIAERLVQGSHLSPFVSSDDLRLSLPEFDAPALPASPHTLKDIKDNRTIRHNKGQTDRMTLILTFIQKNKRVSIKEIAGVVTGCSEKTIQRELGSLIDQGLVRKVGERRWSLYEPA